MVGHPVMVGTKTDDISWDILSSIDPRLNTVFGYVKLEFAVRDLAAIWD
jgi:hypothetical protein